MSDFGYVAANGQGAQKFPTPFQAMRWVEEHGGEGTVTCVRDFEPREVLVAELVSGEDWIFPGQYDEDVPDLTVSG